MAHNHGNEYRIRMVHADGTEELSGWMQSEAQVTPALAAIHRAPGTAHWLQTRHLLCPDCRARDPGLWECPLTGIPSTRYRPHDSGYLHTVGDRARKRGVAGAGTASDKGAGDPPPPTASRQPASRHPAEKAGSCLRAARTGEQSCTGNILGS
jgi:hypothetical protein